MPVDQINDLESAIRWIHFHDGQITAWWHEQHQLNAKVEHRFREIEGRISVIEKRVIWAAGVAAGVGGIIGSIARTV